MDVKNHSGRPRKRELRTEEELVKAENELLKKVETAEEKARVVSDSQKYELIQEIITSYSIKNLLSYLCECCRGSRSG